VEKIIYALWRREGERRDVFNARLKAETAAHLLGLSNVRALRLNIQDEHVARAEGLRQLGTNPQMDAAIQLWVDVSHDAFRKNIDRVLAIATGKMAAWLVLESVVIRNDYRPEAEGMRTPGWSQFCFLQRPRRLKPEEWRHNWQVLHTPVAIETQSNVEYVQNLIVRALIEGPRPYAGIVEECFPDDAMDDAHVFFDAANDESKFLENTSRMAESCARFIDIPGGVDVLPTSQYDYRRLG